jgi:hypothetical protein
MWELLTSFLLEIALKVLPSFIVRRLLPKHVLISELEIDFKTKPVLELNRPVPLMRLWFVVDNRSRIDVVLDRALLEVWVGQPLLHGAILRRTTVESREKSDDLAFEAEMTHEQVAEIQHHLANPPQTRPKLKVHIQAYFETKIGWVEVVDSAEDDLPDH